MNLSETIYRHSLNLSESAAREALDFIEFLEQRYAPSPNDAERHRSFYRRFSRWFE